MHIQGQATKNKKTLKSLFPQHMNHYCLIPPQTMKDFLQDILDVGGTALDESTEVVSDKKKKSRKNRISRLEKITQELYLSLVTKVEVLIEEEACLELEYK